MCKTFLMALAKHKRFQRLFLQVRLNKTENVQKIVESSAYASDAQTIKLWILLLASKMSEEFYDEAVNSIKSVRSILKNSIRTKRLCRYFYTYID